MKIALMMAITVDGKIAKSADHLANWTSKADKKLFVQKTKEAGVIIMGRSTYDTIGRPLPGRLNIVMTRSPEAYESVPDILEYTNQSPLEIVYELQNRGYENAIITGGAQINTEFLAKGLIEILYLTVEPKLFGSGIDLFANIDVDIDLTLQNAERIGDNSLFLTYKINV